VGGEEQSDSGEDQPAIPVRFLQRAQPPDVRRAESLADECELRNHHVAGQHSAQYSDGAETRMVRRLKFLAAIALVCACGAIAQVGPIVVSSNHRFLQYKDGTPFFWLGDTAWRLFQKLDREAMERYLENRG